VAEGVSTNNQPLEISKGKLFEKMKSICFVFLKQGFTAPQDLHSVRRSPGTGAYNSTSKTQAKTALIYHPGT
jgi:hypothetical protein